MLLQAGTAMTTRLESFLGTHSKMQLSGRTESQSIYHSHNGNEFLAIAQQFLAGKVKTIILACDR